MDKAVIMNAISEELQQRFPGWQANVNIKRKDFQRPAFLVSYLTSTQQDNGLNVVLCTDYFEITLYKEVDPYHDTDRPFLLSAVSSALGLFSKTHIIAGDRALNLQASGAGMTDNEAQIDLQTTYFELREAGNTVDYETIEKAEITIKEE